MTDSLDPLASFLAAAVVHDATACVRASELYEAARRWAVELGLSVGSAKALHTSLKARGYVARRSNGTYWLGIRLIGVASTARARAGDEQVNHPSHYNQGGVECIDAIEAALGRDGFVAFLRGQVIKYQWRLGLKDVAAQDAAKAHWYSERLQKVLSAPPP